MRPVVLALCVAACAFSQELPAFEVASLKISAPQSARGSNGGPGSSEPARYRFTRASMLDLVSLAYNLQYFQVSSKESLDRDHYDLVANVPAGATKEQFRGMLQRLLAERFSLKVRKDVRDFPAYELVVAKGGHKLIESVTGKPAPAPRRRPGEEFPDLASDKPGMASRHTFSKGRPVVRTSAHRMPASAVAQILQRFSEYPVVDRTGLAGEYDFALECDGGRVSASPDALPDAPELLSPFAAVQQQLGLQVVSKRLPFDVVVVESFNRVPVEN